TVTITGTNDAPTEITIGSDPMQVAENAEGAFVTELSSIDIDDGDSVTYSVDDIRFEIVETLGVGGSVYTLKLKDGVSLDYEAEPTVAVTVTATDTFGASTSRVLTVEVTNVDEGPGGAGGLATWTPAGVEAGRWNASLLTPAAGIVDPEGDPLTYTLVTGPSEGQLRHFGLGLITVGMTLTQAEFDVLRYRATETTGLFGATFTVSDGVNDTPLNVVITVLEGIDSLVVGNGRNNVVDGGAGSDTMSGLNGNDTLYGGSGDDTLFGNQGDDVLRGGEGADHMVGGDGFDYVAYDEVDYGPLVINLQTPGLNTGAAAGDTYAGIEGVIGGRRADLITGNGMGNVLIGAQGNDTLDGVRGNDTLTGGLGSDTFVFSTSLAPDNIDTITDFATGVDKIALSSAVFRSLGASVTADEFVIGTAAVDANDFLIYDNLTGKLYYDADGNGAGAAVEFANLNANDLLVFSDIVIL
ncbi:MAG: hypothetical protein Q7J57_02195, partial [Gemmobacter sp.]|nr:hypothetical protein [Gemmobacter sp.]